MLHIFIEYENHRTAMVLLQKLVDSSQIDEAIQLIVCILSKINNNPWSMMLTDLDALVWVTYAMLHATKNNYHDALEKWRIAVLIDVDLCRKYAEQMIHSQRHIPYNAHVAVFLEEMLRVTIV